MPIKPENKHRYPQNWKEIRKTILAREQYRCKWCSAPNHAWVWRDEQGQWHYAGEQALREAGFDSPPFEIAGTFSDGTVKLIKVIKIVLTIAHLDHTPENVQPDNLAALCQRCHLRYDSKHHARNASRTRRAQRNNQELFSI